MEHDPALLAIWALEAAGGLDEAATAAEELRRAAMGTHSLLEAEAEATAARIALNQGFCDRAIEGFQRALEVTRQFLPRDLADTMTPTHLYHLGAAMHEAKHFVEARDYYEQSIAQGTETRGGFAHWNLRPLYALTTLAMDAGEDVTAPATRALTWLGEKIPQCSDEPTAMRLHFHAALVHCLLGHQHWWKGQPEGLYDQVDQAWSHIATIVRSGRSMVPNDWLDSSDPYQGLSNLCETALFLTGAGLAAKSEREQEAVAARQRRLVTLLETSDTARTTRSAWLELFWRLRLATAAEETPGERWWTLTREIPSALAGALADSLTWPAPDWLSIWRLVLAREVQSLPPDALAWGPYLAQKTLGISRRSSRWRDLLQSTDGED